MRTERFDFPNSGGQQLAALLDLPEAEPVTFALFAHCFTCGKDVLAAKRIAEALAKSGIATLRFDFTGLGASEGEFANTTFSSNVADLVAAADHLRRTRRAPAILIGHSLGGAAVLAAAEAVPEARLVAMIAAPSDPNHVFKDCIPEIRGHGDVEVSLAGRPFHIKREYLDDIAEQRLTDRIANLRKALIIFHASADQIVGIDNATRIFIAAKHPKSFVSLADADHLLASKSDATYVANIIAAWAARYLDMPAQIPADESEAGEVVVTETRQGRFQQEIKIGSHTLLADEPVSVGGSDSGPGPYDFLLAGLGACTSITLRLYADRKSLPLERVSVALKHSKNHVADCVDCETKAAKLDRIDREISLSGPLDAEQRDKLLEIADKRPVDRTLETGVEIHTRIRQDSGSPKPGSRT